VCVCVCVCGALLKAVGERVESADIAADGTEQRVEAQLGASE